jgi:hypothetical protein
VARLDRDQIRVPAVVLRELGGLANCVILDALVADCVAIESGPAQGQVRDGVDTPRMGSNFLAFGNAE